MGSLGICGGAGEGTCPYTSRVGRGERTGGSSPAARVRNDITFMNMRAILISAGIGYLLGSIPFGYLLVRRFRGADVRETGSGNIGATNVARTSPALGLLTLLLDAAKGGAAVGVVLAIYSAQVFGTNFGATSGGIAFGGMTLARLFGVGLHDPRNLAFLAAFAAVTGHIFPVWLKFRGGKGVATGLGSFLVLTPKTILLGLAIFILVLAVFRLVALASIVATASLPAMALWMGEKQKPALLLGAAALLIIVKHHTNIVRMMRGTEPKFRLRRTRRVA
jgi:acyl phosphate:glycerol-3-phosphate acyltransferase